MKMYVLQTMRPEPGFRISHKLQKWQWRHNFCWHDVIVNIFLRCFVYVVNFNYWSKFYINVITGSGIMTIFVYKGLTRNLEIGNTPFEFWLISGDWGKLGTPNLSRMPLMKLFWMLQNARVKAFTFSEFNFMLRLKYLHVPCSL